MAKKNSGSKNKRSARLEPLGTQTNRPGLDAGLLGTQPGHGGAGGARKQPKPPKHHKGGAGGLRALGTQPLSGIWKALGTQHGTHTLRLDMQPGTQGHIEPGQQRNMKVSLSKAKSKGKTVLKLTLEG